MEKQFEFKLDKVNKILNAKAIGRFNTTDPGEFLKEYDKCVSSINPKEYELNFNCRELGVLGKDINSGEDLTEVLKGLLQMYQQTGFKKIIFDCTGNKIMSMQLKRISKAANIQNVEVL